jgi:apolipoprotein N-acyltransferase
VRWSGEHVPGSPFVVMIFDTEEELNRFLQVSIWQVFPAVFGVRFSKIICYESSLSDTKESMGSTLNED